MTKKNTNVPKGLTELFKDTNNFDRIKELSSKTKDEGKRRKIAINKLVANPFQPRVVFDEEKLEELANSIKQHGLIQPIIVRRSKDINHYEIIAGERRSRAAKMAGLDEVDVIVQTWDDKTTRQMTLLENIQREDLNHIEVAKSYKSLQEELSLTQAQLAEMVSKKRSTVANFMRLLDLPEKTKKLVEDGEISGSFARTLLSLKDEKLIEKWSKDEKVRELSVSALEKKVKSLSEVKTPKVKEEKDVHLIEAENKISEYLDCRVVIGPKISKGKIEISFNSPAELSEILAKIDENFEL